MADFHRFITDTTQLNGIGGHCDAAATLMKLSWKASPVMPPTEHSNRISHLGGGYLFLSENNNQVHTMEIDSNLASLCHFGRFGYHINDAYQASITHHWFFDSHYYFPANFEIP